MAESAFALETSVSSAQNQDLSPPSSNPVSGNGAITKAWPVSNENVESMKEDGRMIYVTESGMQVRLISLDEAALPTAPVVEIHENCGPTSWDDRKTKFLITSYKELKEHAERDGSFPTKKVMWQTLAEKINREFGGTITGAQVENRWKTLRRGYQRTRGRNGVSGNYRVHFEREEYRALCDILEKERHVLMGPRQVQDNSESPTHDQKAMTDRFKLVIPFGGHSITWEVLFQGCYPDFPPDFIFDDPYFRPEISDIESLCDWKAKEPTSLLNAVRELLEAYRKQEVSQLEDHSRLQFEYSSLIHQAEFSEADVEVLMNKNRNGSVNFLIRLPVDFARIPPVLTKDNPGEDSAVLLVTFQSPEGTRITPQLYLSPRVEHALGGALALRIPSFPSGGCLMDYVPSVRQLLINKVDQIINGFEKRKEYLAAILSYYGKSLLEYDAESFSKISLLFEWNEFYFILHISIPLYFPQDKPSFIFQSVYHASLGQPYSVMCNDYPYSPRWSGSEMAERARSFILEYIPFFQCSSVKNKS